MFVGMFLLLILNCSLYAQPNDACNSPQKLVLNQWLHEQTNQKATVENSAKPPIVPISCLNTLENDLWYLFDNQDYQKSLQIIIAPNECSTPAGLQAIAFLGDECSHFENRILACASKDVKDTIRLILEKPKPFSKILVYVDGFDGTECDFSIGIFEIPQFHSWDFCKDFRFDYHERGNDWKTPVSIVQQNNRLKLIWDHEPGRFLGYAVQIQMPNGFRTLSCISSEQLVFRDLKQMEYWFNPDKMDNEKKCFRILAYTQNQTISTGIQCFEPKVIQDFWVSPPQPDPNQKNQFLYVYKIKKNVNAQLKITNSKGEVVKQKQLKLKPGNFEGTLDMQDLPAGNLKFEFCVGSECFEYPLLRP